MNENKYKNKNRVGIVKRGKVYHVTVVIDNVPYTQYFSERECSNAREEALKWWHNQKKIAQLLKLDFKEPEW